MRGEGQERLIIFTLTLAYYVALVILENQKRFTPHNNTADLQQRKTMIEFDLKLIEYTYSVFIIISSTFAAI